MGDHFWPAVYPGIAVGILYGLSLGGLRNIALASLGAFVTAYLAFAMLSGFFTADGILPLAAMLAVSLAGAVVLARLGQVLSRSPAPDGDREGRQ